MQKVTALLSALSHQAGMVLTPNLKNLVCRHIDFVKLSNFQVLVIFISDTGIVQKRVIRFDEDIAQDTLDKVSRLVTEELMGLSVASIRTKLVRMLETEKTQFDQLFARAVKLSQEFFAKELNDSEPSELYVGGTLNMLNQPEFADLEKMKLLFRTFEEKRLLIRILDKCIEEEDQERVKVIIGDENIAADVKDLSFVISSYKYGDRALGVVGIVGPKRMDYTQIIPIVDYTAKALSRLLIDRMEM
jgi:heat-inducible transcriptional repressor